jgi:two-component system NtrC family response regulator
MSHVLGDQMQSPDQDGRSPAGDEQERSFQAGMASALVVDDEPGIRHFLRKALAKRFGLVEVAENVQEAEALRQRCHFDVIIADIRLPGRSGVEWMEQMRAEGDDSSVIFMTAHADLDTAISALRLGASDFLLKPFRTEQMLTAVERCLGHRRIRRENYVLKREVSIQHESGFVGKSESVRNLCELIKRVAPINTTVLLEGESGTGKELAARAIHRWSGREGSFVAINCGALTPDLLESELFGHAKGAFTGAQQARDGLFTYASGGTLFLDEIGEMPLAMQPRLLRVIEERTTRPVGSNHEIPVDVRIIAATNRHLEDEVTTGRFREDLFYRLNVLAMRLPPLRERQEDIPPLVEHFVQALSKNMGMEPPEVRESDLMRMMDYEWPGNVRELRNVIERCLLLGSSPGECLVTGDRSDKDEESEFTLEAVEKRHILKVLGMEDGNKSAAARRLGIARKTLERKLKEWGLMGG